jgi:hypothetical protein
VVRGPHGCPRQVLPLRHCIEQLLGRAGDERPLCLRSTAPPHEGTPSPVVAAGSTGSVELALATDTARGRDRERGAAPPLAVAAASMVSVELAPAAAVVSTGSGELAPSRPRRRERRRDRGGPRPGDGSSSWRACLGFMASPGTTTRRRGAVPWRWVRGEVSLSSPVARTSTGQAWLQKNGSP